MTFSVWFTDLSWDTFAENRQNLTTEFIYKELTIQSIEWSQNKWEWFLDIVNQ